MRFTVAVLMLAVLGCGRPEQVATEPAAADATPEKPAGQPCTCPWPDPPAVEALYREFDGFLASQVEYAKRIRRDSAEYPEGPMLTLALPAYGFANYALAHPEAAPRCRANIDRLIQIASERWVAQRLDYPMRDDILKLDHWNGQGFFLGHYGLMLGCYRLAGGDEKYAEHQQRIARLIRQGFHRDKHGAWISSYRERTWLFDSLACLLALRLADEQNGKDLKESSQLVGEHLRYRRGFALDKASGLPNTEIDPETGRAILGPRGCDLSGTVCFLTHLAPGYCHDLYRAYKKTYWTEVDLGVAKLSGFREWPQGRQGFMDADSGPIVLGIGAAASGFGLGASRVAGDDAAHRALLDTLDRSVTMFDTAGDAVALLQKLEVTARNLNLPGADALATPSFASGLPIAWSNSKDYRYRHLMGDAVAFFCLTWRPWCKPVEEK